MSSHPLEQQLHAIVDQVWASYLDVDGASPLVHESPGAPVVDVTALVSVTGSWRGHVVVTCSDGAARHAAAALLGIELDDVCDEDVVDALGELANIIGGNVKALLPEPCALSLPHVFVEGAGRYPAVTRVCQLDGSWLGESVSVQVLESTDEFAGAKAA